MKNYTIAPTAEEKKNQTKLEQQEIQTDFLEKMSRLLDTWNQTLLDSRLIKEQYTSLVATQQRIELKTDMILMKLNTYEEVIDDEIKKDNL